MDDIKIVNVIDPKDLITSDKELEAILECVKNNPETIKKAMS